MIYVRDWLYIGNYRDSMNKSALERNRIDSILHLAENVSHDGIYTFPLLIEDGLPISHDIIAEGIDFIINEYEQENILLIACGAGISRSASFVVAALKEIEGLDLKTAYFSLRDEHPNALPHYHLWESLCEYYEEDVPYMDIIK